MQETQKTPVQLLGQEDPLEKEMATHSSILSWEIPLTEEPGELQSMGLQRLSDGARTHSRSSIRQSLSRGLVLTHSGLPDSNTLEFSRTPQAGKAGQKHFPKPEGNSTLTKAPHGDAGLSISLPATAAGVLGGARRCVHPVPKCLKGTNLGLVKLHQVFFKYSWESSVFANAEGRS